MKVAVSISVVVVVLFLVVFVGIVVIESMDTLVCVIANVVFLGEAFENL